MIDHIQYIGDMDLLFTKSGEDWSSDDSHRYLQMIALHCPMREIRDLRLMEATSSRVSRPDLSNGMRIAVILKDNSPRSYFIHADDYVKLSKAEGADCQIFLDMERAVAWLEI